MCHTDEDVNTEKGIGDLKMITTTLDSIEKRVKKNSANSANIIKNFQNRTEERGFKKGRVKPRSVTEQKILDSFKRK